jgi:recombination protein RecA
MASLPSNRASLLARSFAFGLGLDGFRRPRAVELQPSGVTELDAVLGGGFPRGSLVELCGPASSGRTSLAFSLLASATQQQQACAFVDVTDSLDPASLAAAGVDLPRLLWIRCGEMQGGGSNGASLSGAALSKASTLSAAVETEGASAEGRLSSGGEPSASTSECGWRHPRDQIRGIESAIPSLLHKNRGSSPNAFGLHEENSPREIGLKKNTSKNTAQRVSVVAPCAEEQVERDRELPRRGMRMSHRRATPTTPELRDSELHVPELRVEDLRSPSPSRPWKGQSKRPWKNLEQALKATDLLLHSGGWGVVVFDLGGIAWTEARRINLSMWFRFRRAVENTPTILLLLGEKSCARSCAALVLHCRRKGEGWSRAASVTKPAAPAANSAKAAFGVSIFEDYEVEGEIIRSRTQSHAADSARWQTRTRWTAR